MLTSLEKNANNENGRRRNVKKVLHRGSAIDRLFLSSSQPINFAIFGGQKQSRNFLLRPFLEKHVSELPIILLHNHNEYLVDQVYHAWTQQTNNMPEQRGGFCCINQENRSFELFADLSERECLNALRELVGLSGYENAPSFERVAKAHFSILEALKARKTLAGLFYLCRIEDEQIFQRNIYSLPISQVEKDNIWSNFSCDSNQLWIFRSIIERLAEEMQDVWQQQVSSTTIQSVIRNKGVLTLDVSRHDSKFFLNALATELKSVELFPFILLVDSIQLHDTALRSLLSNATGSYFKGVLAEDVFSVFGTAEQFEQCANRFAQMVVLHIGQAALCEPISTMAGEYEHQVVDQNTSKQAGLIFSSGKSKGVSIRTERRRRVTCENIMELREQQFFLFDFSEKQIYQV